MQLFKLKKNNSNIVKIASIKSMAFKDENKEMHTIFNPFLKEIFDIEFIKGKFGLMRENSLFELKPKIIYEIDALGLNKKSNPVIIEYGRGRNKKSISQTFGYYNHLQKSPNNSKFEKIVKEKLGGMRVVDWNKVIIYIIAQAFKKGEFETVKAIEPLSKNFDFHFYSYNFFGGYLVVNEEEFQRTVEDDNVHKIIARYKGDQEKLLQLHRRIKKMGFEQYYGNSLKYSILNNGRQIFEIEIRSKEIFIKPLKILRRKYKKLEIVDITNLNLDAIERKIRKIENCYNNEKNIKHKK